MAETGQGPLILDTHVWLWIAGGDTRHISTGTIATVENASRAGEILISAISIWEVAMLESKGRISLSRSVDEWVRKSLRAPGVRLLELSPEIAIESTRLPEFEHGDPADRMLIASARVTGGRLATADRRILEYASRGHVAVLDSGM